MKVLFLCKQRYMNHDVISDKYGRLYHVPYELSCLSHSVQCYCLRYQSRVSDYKIQHQYSATEKLNWHSEYAGKIGQNIPGYVYKLIEIVNLTKPDAIIGSSDILHVIITSTVARRTSTPYFIDLYDNYESFGMSRIPGMVWGYRKALGSADGIFTVSNPLRDYVRKIAPQTKAVTIESTISAGNFSPIPMSEAREKLNLPKDKPLIGTAGSLSQKRGTDNLYNAFFTVKEKYEEACLVLAGPIDGNPPPAHQDIIYLGELPHTQIPQLFNALDVAVICMKDDHFGKYAFPQKAYEILACNVPAVCAAVGALKELFKDYTECLYAADDATDLAIKITAQLQHKIRPDLPIPTWKDQALKIEKAIMRSISH
jgi:glycosyltransferase involved in cell wall biosynthesis